MLFPFLSRAAHLEIVQAKDETISTLRTINTVLLEQMGRMTHPTAAEVHSPSPAAVPHIHDKPTPADYSNIDPTDNHALMKLALAELGPGARSASLLQRKIQHIRMQVVEARQGDTKRRQQPGLIATEIPADVLDRINGAEIQGKADARV